MASDFMTRAEAAQQAAALREEMARDRRASEQRDMELSTRLSVVETTALDIRTTVLDVRDALFMRLDAQDEARARQMADLKDTMATAARVKRYERVATTLAGLALNLPVLRWLKLALGWLLAVAGGVGLGAMLFGLVVK